MCQVENRISPMLNVVLVSKTSLVIRPPNACLRVGSFDGCGTPAMYAVYTIVHDAVREEEAPSESMVVSMSHVVSSLKWMPGFSKSAMCSRSVFLKACEMPILNLTGLHC